MVQPIPLGESPLQTGATQDEKWQVVMNTLSVFLEPENSVLGQSRVSPHSSSLCGSSDIW